MTPASSVRAALAAAVLATSVIGPAAHAQSDPSSLPTEFVALLMRTVSDGANMNTPPAFTIGLPPFLSSQLSGPPGGKIVGAVSWQSTVDVVGTAAGTVDAVRTWFADDFVKRGYKPAITDFASQYGGFRDPIASPAVSGYCGNNAQYTISVRYHDASSSDFRIRVTSSFGVCTAGRGGAVSANVRGAPLVQNPPLAERATRCNAAFGGMGGMTTYTGFVTSMQPSDILTHYGRQLDSAGWKLQTPVPAAATWVKKDSLGRQMATTISINTLPSAQDCRSASMQFSEIRP